MILPIAYNRYCSTWNKIYIKSNGRIPCWCDAGESHTIINYTGNKNFINDVVNCQEMRKIRLDFIMNDIAPIKQCSNCSLFQEVGKPISLRHKKSDVVYDLSNKIIHAQKELNRIVENRKWPIGSIDIIDEIQLEPSLPCNLKCPGCPHGFLNVLDTESPPYLFPFQWFRWIIDDSINHNIMINRINYCGKGEPTLNRQLSDMIIYANKAMPSIKQSMDTNANQEFKDEYLQLEYINCSIDGSSENEYQLYRRNGNWNEAISFMKNAVIRKKKLNSSCKIIWKYILFNSNDSIKALNYAQKLAKEYEIDMINFVITSCGSFDNSIIPSKNFLSIVDFQNYFSNNEIFENTIVTYN